MTDDPRVIVAQEWLVQPDGRHLEIARAFLAELDAVDPLRQPVSGNGLPDRLRSTTELMANVASVPMDVWDRHSNTCLEAASEIERLRALAAADRVQAPAEKPDFPPWSAEFAAAFKFLLLDTEGLWSRVGQTVHAERTSTVRLLLFPETQDAG